MKESDVYPSPQHPIPSLHSSRFFFHQHDFPAAVVAASSAGAVRQLRFVAMRAFRQGALGQMVVGPASARARFGMSSFRIGHNSSLPDSGADDRPLFKFAPYITRPEARIRRLLS